MEWKAIPQFFEALEKVLDEYLDENFDNIRDLIIETFYDKMSYELSLRFSCNVKDKLKNGTDRHEQKRELFYY